MIQKQNTDSHNDSNIHSTFQSLRACADPSSSAPSNSTSWCAMSEFAGYTRAELLILVEKLTREQNSIACQTPCDMASQTDEPEPEPQKKPKPDKEKRKKEKKEKHPKDKKTNKKSKKGDFDDGDFGVPVS